MKLFIYETNIPSWSNPAILQERINQWKRANISTVFLMVDDGKGATWPSALCPTDPRINTSDEPLKRAVASIRNAGISCILVFNIIGIVQTAMGIKPEWYLPTNDYYNFWNSDFRDWRKNYILEALQHTSCDAIALDYIRTGRAALQSEIPSSDLVYNFLSELRRSIPSYLQMINVSHTIYIHPNSQGVNYLKWYEHGLIGSILVYNYNEQFPFNDVMKLPQQALWILNSNFNLVNGVAVSKTSEQFENMCRRMYSLFNIAGYGIYNANMLTEEHITTLSALHLQEKRR